MYFTGYDFLMIRDIFTYCLTILFLVFIVTYTQVKDTFCPQNQQISQKIASFIVFRFCSAFIQTHLFLMFQSTLVKKYSKQTCIIRLKWLRLWSVLRDLKYITISRKSSVFAGLHKKPTLCPVTLNKLIYVCVFLHIY